MEKRFNVVFLNPLRPDFVATKTESESDIMQQHVDSWKDKMKQGKVYTFGNVIDPNKIYGHGVQAVANEQELKNILARDPA